MSILVVEDDPNLRRALELGLGQLGHLVLSSPRVGEAAKMLDGCEVDLVITDHRLPDGTSDELLAAMRQLSCTPRTILISGWLGSGDEEPQSGFAATLAKPFSTGLLQRAVCKALGRPL